MAIAISAMSLPAAFANGRVASSNRWPVGHRHTPKAQYEAIDSVNEGAKTITITHVNSTNHTNQALKVDNFTQITVDGLKATMHDLKPGMKVDVTHGMDDTVAATLVATNVK